jgi:hypothetical protein
MSNEQAPPARLVIDVTIKDGKVTPTNEQFAVRRERADRRARQQRRR